MECVFPKARVQRTGLLGLSSFSSNCSPFGVSFVSLKIFFSCKCVQEAIWKPLVPNLARPSLRSGRTALFLWLRLPSVSCFVWVWFFFSRRVCGAGPALGVPKSCPVSAELRVSSPHASGHRG